MLTRVLTGHSQVTRWSRDAFSYSGTAATPYAPVKVTPAVVARQPGVSPDGVAQQPWTYATCYTTRRWPAAGKEQVHLQAHPPITTRAVPTCAIPSYAVPTCSPIWAVKSCHLNLDRYLMFQRSCAQWSLFLPPVPSQSGCRCGRGAPRGPCSCRRCQRAAPSHVAQPIDTVLTCPIHASPFPA